MKPFSSGAKILARIGRCGDRQVKGAKQALGHTWAARVMSPAYAL